MSDAPQRLRVGLVGYGLGGSTFHAPLISVTPGLELVAATQLSRGGEQGTAVAAEQVAVAE